MHPISYIPTTKAERIFCLMYIDSNCARASSKCGHGLSIIHIPTSGLCGGRGNRDSFNNKVDL